MQLELSHLACYLPYGLKMKVNDVQFYGYKVMTLCDKCGLSNIGISTVIDELQDFTPILHPLSDLTKEIEHNGEKFVPIERLIEDFDKHGENGFDFSYLNTSPLNYPYYIVQKLFEWHFDVFGLIESGLAVDINTLTK